MPASHLLLALAVVVVWGTNFVVIRVGLAEWPPFLFAALRFALTALPWLLLVRRPAVPWRTLAGYGVVLGVGQFGLLFLAMKADISPGLASLVVQMQAFFTIALAMLLHGERPAWAQAPALALALAGLAWIGWHALHTVSGDGLSSATPLGLALVLAAGMAWAVANLLARSANGADPLAFIVWSGGFAVPPLLGLALLLDGPPAMLGEALVQASWAAWAAVLWQSLGNTLFGYSAWNWLLARHPAATVVPLSLLVPVAGMSASALWLGEAMPAWKLGAGALIVAGLGWNLWVTRPRAAAMARDAMAEP